VTTTDTWLELEVRVLEELDVALLSDLLISILGNYGNSGTSVQLHLHWYSD